MPTIVTAHFLWLFLIDTGIFCAVLNYAEKAELSRCNLVFTNKIGGNTHFSEIIKLQFGKEHHTLLCFSKLFTNIVD